MEVHSFTMFNVSLFFLIFLTVDSKNTKNCRLMFKETKDNQKNLLKPAELLTITIELENSTNLPDSLVKDSNLFQPLIWKRISSTHGKGLLQLKPVYEMLSLSLLSYETEETSITLKFKPKACLENLTELEYEHVFRFFLLNFTKENDEICNEHIGEMSGYARFYHECCQYDSHGNIQCSRVFKNKWMQAIHYCTYIVIIIVVLYCPLLIPSSMYDPKHVPKQFVYYPCYPDDSLSFTFMKETAPSNRFRNMCQRTHALKDGETTVVPYHTLTGMKDFSNILKNIDCNKRYKIRVTKIHFSVRKDNILTTNEVPTSSFSVLYDMFFKCSIRKKLCVANCCLTDICGKYLPISIGYPWYKLLRVLLRIVFSVVVCLPWIIRICFFYFYEYEIRESRHKAAENRNLLVRIENNLAYYGTPLHVLFILSYSLLCFGYIFLELTSMILFRKVTCLVRQILTKCFVEGMFGQSKQKVVQRSIEYLLEPCSKYGIFGMLFWLPYWICVVPLIMAASAYLFFPAVHIIVNFLLNFASLLHKQFQGCIYKSKKCDKSSLLTITPLPKVEIGIMFILLCIMLSSLLLTIELVIFLIKIAIYTMVGMILNSSHAMQYISIISLAWLYYRRCFGGSSQIFMDYNKAIHTILYRVNKRQLDAVAKKEINQQENTAFKVINECPSGQKSNQVETATEDKYEQSSKCCSQNDENKRNKKVQEKKIDTSDGALKLKTSGVILLLDMFDKQYITKKFFFNACKIKQDGPGPLSKHFLTAIRQFGIIIIFLIFVTLVVLAFGDSYSVNFSNQLLATLAGGVVPWILMKSNILFVQSQQIDANELVKRYFSDEEITNEILLIKIQKYLQETNQSDINEHKETSDITTHTNGAKAENSHQLLNGEVMVKGVFKKNFNEKIAEDVKWWNIADIDGTYEEFEEADAETANSDGTDVAGAQTGRESVDSDWTYVTCVETGSQTANTDETFIQQENMGKHTHERKVDLIVSIDSGKTKTTEQSAMNVV